MSSEYTWCFACGKDNPIGLKLDFDLTDTEYSTTFIPLPEHQSYNGRVHGGLISTLLDEVMAGYVYASTGQVAFTARLEIRYRQPVLIGQPVKVIGTFIKQKGRMYEMKGELFLADGTLAAESTGKVLLAD